MQQVLQQAGAIPYSLIDGEIRVMLVTSRDTGRWLIPKGYVDPGLTPAAAAAKEAYEEAGIKGVMETMTPLGFFTYFKKRKSGLESPASVQVFLLRVDKQCKKWPEMKQRKFAWFSPAEAAQLVKEPGLSALLLRLEGMAGNDRMSHAAASDERDSVNYRN